MHKHCLEKTETDRESEWHKEWVRERYRWSNRGENGGSRRIYERLRSTNKERGLKSMHSSAVRRNGIKWKGSEITDKPQSYWSGLLHLK